MVTSTSEARLLRGVKIGLVLMLLVFGIQLFARIPEYWPVTRWTMYDDVAAPPETVEQHVVYAHRANAEPVLLRPQDLGFIAEKIMRGSVEDNDSQADYRALLINRVRLALNGDDLSEIEIWLQSWIIDKWQSPPFDLEQPDDSTLLSSFRGAEGN